MADGIQKGLLKGLNRNVIVLGVVSLLNDAASEMIYPLLPMFLTTVLGAGPAALGVIEGLAESTVSILKLFSGYISDRVSRRKGWIVAGYIISNIIRPLIAVAGSWLTVLGLRMADRIGKGIRTSPRDALIADSVPHDLRGTAYGFHRAMDHAGAIMGPLVATSLLLLMNKNLKSVFLLSFIPGAIAAVMLIVGLKELTSQRREERGWKRLNFRAALAETPKDFRLYLLAIFIFTLGNSSDAFLLLQAQKISVSTALIPTIWVVLHTVKVVFSIPGGMISDRIGRKKVIFAGWVIYALVYIGFALADRQWHMWALFAVYGVYFGLTEGVEKALVADLSPLHLRGSCFGLYHLTVGSGALPASLIFGLVWERFGAHRAFGLGALLALVAGAMLILLVRAGKAGAE